ncbi:hypothetical protein [Halosimplex salinum]|uniref:hypothetical protein n=1 Tax=Halosimplex salinum TaxID=1710538 RepID=UPI000F4637F2|nr:hypothetical protein [Halosimplex salinum]
MPSETVALLRSIRRWLMSLVFVLGVGVVTLANTGYVVSGYQDGLLFALAGVAGGTVALASALTWVGDFASQEAGSRDS